MIILKDPDRARQLGLLGPKAQLFGGTADWPSILGLLSQAVAVGGAVLFAFLTAWVFGREFADRTFPGACLAHGAGLDRHRQDAGGRRLVRGHRRVGSGPGAGDGRGGRSAGLVRRRGDGHARRDRSRRRVTIGLQTVTALFATIGRG